MSWDLFIIVVFTVIIAYSFIIGKETTLKVIIGTYIAILTADALGNLFQDFFLASQSFTQFLRLLAINTPEKAIMLFKIVIFLLAVVVLSMKGQFTVLRGRQGGIIGFFTSLIFAVLNGGLVVATLLVYASGGTLVGGPFEVSSTIQPIYVSSRLVKLMIDNSALWFSLPAIAFVIWSAFGESEEVEGS